MSSIKLLKLNWTPESIPTAWVLIKSSRFWKKTGFKIFVSIGTKIAIKSWGFCLRSQGFFFAIDFDRLLWELKNRTKWANRGFFKNKSAESKFEDCYLARPYLGRALKKFITFYEIKDGWEVKSVIIKVRKNNTTEIMKIYKDKNKNIRLNVQEDWSGEFK